jgi:hypothetical protein
MKKFYILLVALFVMNGATGQSDQPCGTCLPQGITFSSQYQVDHFQTNHPGCTEILGYVKISGGNISSLNGLSVLTSIGGYLSISYNTSLTNLSGLEGLTSIWGTLSIEYNYVLTSISGLESLTSVGGSGLWIHSNPVLTSLTGLENLTSVDGGTQGGYVSIDENPLLTDLSGLEGLTSIGRELRIWNNFALTSLTGLEGLNSIEEELNIQFNSSLNNLMGLVSLTSLGGSLVIMYNPLTSLTGLEGLTTIGGGISFLGNNTLANFTGLQNLKSISGELYLNGNDALSSLSGLESINGSSITDLTITWNNSLSSCAIQSICDYLVSPNGTVDIRGNAPGCNSQQEVEDDCAAIGVQDLTPESLLLIYPNPTSNTLTIETIIKGHLSILNLSGKELLQQEITEKYTAIDVSVLENGVYVMKVIGEKGVQVGKLIKQ